MDNNQVIQTLKPYPASMDRLLMDTLEKKASDLHITAGAYPIIRLNGELVPLDYPKMTPTDINNILIPVLEPYHQKMLEESWELDFSYSIPGRSRFRGNIMRQRGSLAIAFRVIPYTPPDIATLHLPAAIKELCNLPRGLVLVTGPTGSGKSTTLAALIELINTNRSLNIVTVEEPIEFLYKHNKSIIKQREVGTDTRSFAEALKRVLRHDPDVILIGEMRDMESVSIALAAAETGHLVFSTLHTQTAPLAIHRIVDIFSEGQRSQVRQQLADSIQAVIAQQLIPTADGKGRAAAVELLLSTPAVRNLIREGKEPQLYTTMQTSKALGMQTMDNALADLYRAGKISREMAILRCVDKVELDRQMQKGPTSGPTLGSGFSGKDAWQ